MEQTPERLRIELADFIHDDDDEYVLLSTAEGAEIWKEDDDQWIEVSSNPQTHFPMTEVLLMLCLFAGSMLYLFQSNWGSIASWWRDRNNSARELQQSSPSDPPVDEKSIEKRKSESPIVYMKKRQRIKENREESQSPSQRIIPEISTSEEELPRLCTNSSDQQVPTDNDLDDSMKTTAVIQNRTASPQLVEGVALSLHQEKVAKPNKSYSVPLLLSESPVVLSGQDPVPATSMQRSVSLLGVDDLKRTIHDADKIVQATKIFRQVLIQHGEDPSAALECALRQQQSERFLECQVLLEDRRLLWDGLQRECDRVISDQRHEEMMAAIQHDKDWLEKLQRARDNCIFAACRGLVHSLGVLSLIEVSLPLYRVLRGSDFSRSQGVMGLIVDKACGCHRTSEPSTILPRYSLIGPFTNSGLVESIGCYGSCLFRCVSLFLLTIFLHSGGKLLHLPRLFHNVVNMCFFLTLGAGWQETEGAIFRFLGRYIRGILLHTLVTIISIAVAHILFQQARQKVAAAGSTSRSILEASLISFDKLYWRLSVSPCIMLLVAAVSVGSTVP